MDVPATIAPDQGAEAFAPLQLLSAMMLESWCDVQ